MTIDRLRSDRAGKTTQMRIGLEMFGTQTAGRDRGVGRYARNLAAALCADSANLRAAHELVLYADASGPLDRLPSGRGATTRLIRPEPTLRAAVARLVRENPDALDALVFLNPLELTAGYDLPPRPVSGPRSPVVAAVLYDLIPLRFPEGYLRRWPGATLARRYHWALERLRQYDRLLAISDATREDAIRLLNVPPERVVTVGAGGDDPGLARGAASDANADAARLAALGLTGKFLFAVAATDPRKNLDGLLAAFSRLPPALRTTHRLAVAAGIGPGDAEAAMVWQKAGSLGIAAALVLTGRVDDATLGALYRRCAAFVFPSLYEGFGLPIVEALAAGAVVVAGDNSAQPEAAGDAALLVNCADPDALAGAIARALGDPALVRTLRHRGPAHAARFTWVAVAARMIEAVAPPVLAGGSARRPAPARGSPRIAVFAPLPPHPAGVAGGVEDLIVALAEHCAIDVFHGSDEWPFARFQSRSIGCYDRRLFPRLNRVRPYDRVIQ
jgi:glycosyltransferase involved in cell wall biosynthesis